MIELMTKEKIRQKISRALQKMGMPTEMLNVSAPAQEGFGDYSVSVALQLAKTTKRNPMEIAQEIADNIEKDGLIEKVEVMKPGFINLWISKDKLLNTLQNIDSSFGNNITYQGKSIIVEYSSPNIAKPFTVGHLRSTIIGDAVANLLSATGATVFRDNHLGDWGTQFGKQIYAIKTWGNEQQIELSDNPVKELVALYVKFHEEAEKDPKIEEEGRKWFKKLEEGDEEARRLWKKCIDWSWKEFNKIYEKLGISFTENEGRGYGESFFEDKMQPVIAELRKKNLLKESKGAELVFYPDDKLPPLMIIKQDGATLYSTRDLATDKFRLENPRYGQEVMIINEVGAEQALYFKQIFELEQMLGWTKEGQRIHIKHGMYRFKDMKMSTRKGNTIWLEDVLEEATKRAFELSKHESKFEGSEVVSINNKHSDSAKKNIMGFGLRSNVAEKVGIGAIKWNDLKRSSHLDIVFDWDEILNMQGNSGPYVQYTYVRCKSVLNKVSVVPSEVEGSLSFHEEETAILRTLIKYPEVVTDAANNFAPNYITTYLYDLSQKYNLFYQKHQILKEKKEDTRNFRILLTEKVATVLSHGLSLLGIETVEKM
ncbi:arginine--tRNA ligase [Candidatus Roizmanbacteria bacterium]|nr:MAG: arginine--tRNA ligase [Candidatus Roizmanbacteria bacterium]